MKKYLVHLFLFTLPFLIGYIVLGFYSDGNTDNYYLRFTTDQQSSLILGNSRAAQGLQPQEFNTILGSQKYLYNYAFNIKVSPYGPAYLKAIKAKIDPQTTDGIFILTVDPWSVSNPKKTPNEFVENQSFINKLYCHNSYPNYEYLLKYYHQPWINLYRYNENKGKSSIYLHPDGWLEVSIKVDSGQYKTIEKSKLKAYQKAANTEAISDQRMHYLKKTISSLSNFGKVYLVRLPQSTSFQQIENEYAPHFDSLIDGISKEYQIPYYNLTYLGHEMQYKDGNHLNITSGKRVSQILAYKIQTHEQ